MSDKDENVCSNCGAPFHESNRLCPGCNSDLGFPNVRAAQKPQEVEALRQRCADAEVSTRERKCESVLLQFNEAVKKSKAVINRDIGIVKALVSNDNALYNSFYHSVDEQARLPEDNPFDRSRPSIDSTLFPFYHKEMRFAALSLDGHGIQKYGALTMILREDIIKQRATVFEENSMDFCKRQKIVTGSSIPSGYRAVWNKRHELAIAKLHSLINPTTTPDEFTKILLKSGEGTTNAEFIEVHIYGSFTRRGIEKIVGNAPKRKEDKVLMKSIRTKLKEFGATTDVD
ncbi:MAG TPA: zinc ribbon domain-containing protein [Nitrospira sp.]